MRDNANAVAIRIAANFAPDDTVRTILTSCALSAKAGLPMFAVRASLKAAHARAADHAFADSVKSALDTFDQLALRD